jgi:hypothetical protein
MTRSTYASSDEKLLGWINIFAFNILLKNILRKIGRKCYVNLFFPCGCEVEEKWFEVDFREKTQHSRIKDCAMLNERKNNPISSYTNIKIHFFTMVCIPISFDKNVRTFGNCEERKWKDFILLPSHINSQFLSPFSSCLSIKKEFIGFGFFMLLVPN